MSSDNSKGRNKIEQINELKKKLHQTNDLEERAKIHAQVAELSVFSEDLASENVDPLPHINRKSDENDFVLPVNTGKPIIHSISLLPTGTAGRNPPEPFPEECSSITSIGETETRNLSNRKRLHSISSNSSTSSKIQSVPTKTKRARSITPGKVRLAPDAEKRIMNYNYRGPLPSKHHCQRSLFGKTIDVEPMETPKKSKSSTSLRQRRTMSNDRKNYTIPRFVATDVAKKGLTLHQFTCGSPKCGHDLTQGARDKTPVRIGSKSQSLKKPQNQKADELIKSPAQRRLDDWRPLNRSRSPISASTPTMNKQIQKDEDGYAIPSIRSGNSSKFANEFEQIDGYPQVFSPSTPQHFYKTPMTNFKNNELSDDSNERFYTPSIIMNSSKDDLVAESPIIKKIKEKTRIEIEKIDARLAEITMKSSTNSSLRITQKSQVVEEINLTPRTKFIHCEDALLKEEHFREKPILNSYEKVDHGSAHETAKFLDEKMNFGSSFPSSSEVVEKSSKEYFTSLKPEKLYENFCAALKMNVSAQRKYCLREQEYAKRSGLYDMVHLIDSKLKELPLMEIKSREQVKNILKDYNKTNVTLICKKMKELQDEVRIILLKVKKNQQRRERQSIRYSVFGELNVNEFERESMSNLNQRLEKAKKVVETVKKIDAKKLRTEMIEAKAMRKVVRMALSNKMTSAVPMSSSTEKELLLDSDSQKISSSTLSGIKQSIKNQKVNVKLGSDGVSTKKSSETRTKSQSKIPLLKSGKTNLTQVLDSISSSKSDESIFVKKQIPQVTDENDKNSIVDDGRNGKNSDGSQLPSGIVIPLMDFSPLHEKEKDECVVEREQAEENIPEDGDAYEITEFDTKGQQLKSDLMISGENVEKNNDTPVADAVNESAGRTSRGIPSIAEFDEVKNDVKDTEDEVSTLTDRMVNLDVGKHGNMAEVLTPTSNITEDVISVLSSKSASSGTDLQSLRSILNEEDNHGEDVEQSLANEQNLGNVQQDIDSDPEHIPTTGDSLIPSKISSLKLKDDSPVPSPPHVTSEAIPAQNEQIEPTEELSLLENVNTPSDIAGLATEIHLPEENNSEATKSVTSIESPANLLFSKSDDVTSSITSNVIVPKSLENSEQESIVEEIPKDIKGSEKSEDESTSSTQTSISTSVGSTIETKSKSSSNDSGQLPEKEKESSKSDSIPEELPSAGGSMSLSNSYPISEELSKSKNDDMDSSEISTTFNNSISNSGFDSSLQRRRKSWEMVETGTFKKDVTYLHTDDVDKDITDQPKLSLENRPSLPPLSRFAAVSPRSPRNSLEHRKSLSTSKSFNKSGGSTRSPTIENDVFDFNLSDVAAPIFDVSDPLMKSPDRTQQNKDINDWSPGFTKELVLNVEPVLKKSQIEEETPRSDDETVTTEFGEAPLDKSEKNASLLIKKFVNMIWNDYERKKNGEFNEKITIRIAPVPFEHPERLHKSYEKLIADCVCRIAEELLKFKINSKEKFQNLIENKMLSTLGLERRNDLLHPRHKWIKKNGTNMNLFTAFHYKNVYKYCTEREFALPDQTYQQCKIFLQKHAPEQLQEYENEKQ